jgi:hypothetical protein
MHGTEIAVDVPQEVALLKYTMSRIDASSGVVARW